MLHVSRESSLHVVELINDAVARQQSFCPTCTCPSPGLSLSDPERADWLARLKVFSRKFDSSTVHHLHDLAGLLAERKPAALVDHSIFHLHRPLATELQARLAQLGHSLLTYDVEDGRKVVRLAYVALPEVLVQFEELDEVQDEAEWHRRRGLLLGYPVEAVEDFLTRWRMVQCV